MNDSTLLDLISAYALGALSDEERAQVEAFLAQSEEARNELRVYQEMLTGLAATAPARKAPAHLTEDFRQRLNAASTIIPMPQRRVTISTRWIVAAAALLVVMFGALFVYLSTQSDPQQQTIRAILSDNAATKVALAPQPNTNGTVSFVTVPGKDQGVLTAQLPPLENQKQYQLWFIKDNNPEASVTFDGTTDSKPLLVMLPASIKNYDAVAITVEPRGGSKAPTTSPIFVGELS
jgi:anti-sigma-K factor RskA